MRWHRASRFSHGVARRQAFRALLATFLLALFAACSGARPEETEATASFSQALTATGQGQLDVYVPKGVNLDAVAVGSTWGLIVHDNGNVLASEEGVVPVVANRGLAAPQVWQNKTELKAKSSAPIVYSGIEAFVNSDATISDLLFAPTLLPQTGSNVSHWEDGTPEFLTFSRGIQFPTLPDAWIFVDRGQTHHLVPGSYSNYSVKDGGTLELTPGRYYFRSLGAEPDSTLRVTGPAGGVFIYVKGDFTFRGVQAFEDPGQEMMVVSFAPQVYLERPFEGVVMAPEGTLALGGTTGQTFTGQFFGAYVEIRNGATIGLRPFSHGLWDDADECAWGADEGAECDFANACPGASERRCVSRACSCQLGTGAGPSDECAIIAGSGSRPTLLYTAEGTPCTPAFGCSGTPSCNGRGYCICTGASPSDGGECTDLVGTSPSGASTLGPVADGTFCASASGSCASDPTCSGGACRCNDLGDDAPAGCSMIGRMCAGYTCTHGSCEASSDECVCPELSAMTPGRPFRFGTQNVHALPIMDTRSFANCDIDYWSWEDTFRCQAGKMADKVLESDYDMIAFNEVFDDNYREVLLDKLRGHGPGQFPYVVARADSDDWYDQDEDSGLMLFSRWPFEPRLAGERRACFVGDGRYNGTKVYGMPHDFDPAVNFEVFEDAIGYDSWANKGLAHARVRSFDGLVYDVFFTHTNSTDIGGILPGDGDTTEEQELSLPVMTRKKQFERINQTIGCVTTLSQSDVVVLAGDLNVQGDLSNPAGTVAPWEGMPAEPPEIWGGDSIETRNEWDMLFNRLTPAGAPPPVLSANGLLDSWAWAMTNQCIPISRSVLPNAVCQVMGSRSNKLETLQLGAVGFDRGASAVGVYPDGEQRLDYIFLGTGPIGEFVQAPQHVSIAHNLKDGHQGTSSFLRQHDNSLEGGDPLSDHLGLNAEIDDPADYMAPADAYELVPLERVGGTGVSLHFEYETAVKWIRVDADHAGTYVFVVNPRDWMPPRADNGVGFQVFEATDLSSPLAASQGEVITVPGLYFEDGTNEIRPTWRGPDLRQGKYATPNFPLYIKIFIEDVAKARQDDGGFIFYARRLSCNEQAQACDVFPYGNLLGDEGDDEHLVETSPLVTTRGAEAWFAFQLERPDALEPQQMRLFLAEPESQDAIDSVQVIDADSGLPVPMPDFTVRTVTLGSEEYRVWEYVEKDEGFLNILARTLPMTGKKLYLKAIKKADKMDELVKVLPGWSTTLTWVVGPDLGGSACMLKCKATQDQGQDELWMALETLTFDSNSYTAAYPSGVRGEAKNGVELSGQVDKDWCKDWTLKYFASDKNTHPDGTPFPELRTLGFTERLRIVLVEDDYAYQADENAWSTFSVESLRPLPTQNSGRRRATFHNSWWFDGVYDFTGCDFRHGLRVKPCIGSSDCDEPLTCQSGVCR